MAIVSLQAVVQENKQLRTFKTNPARFLTYLWSAIELYRVPVTFDSPDEFSGVGQKLRELGSLFVFLLTQTATTQISSKLEHSQLTTRGTNS